MDIRKKLLKYYLFVVIVSLISSIVIEPFIQLVIYFLAIPFILSFAIMYAVGSLFKNYSNKLLLRSKLVSEFENKIIGAAFVGVIIALIISLTINREQIAYFILTLPSILFIVGSIIGAMVYSKIGRLFAVIVIILVLLVVIGQI